MAHSANSYRLSRGAWLEVRYQMEETLCNVEFLKNNNTYIARVQSDLGGLREYRSASFEEVLEQVIIDLQEEFETAV
jgi:hypothetical protein